MKRIAIFASGTGSNAVNLIKNFRGHKELEVVFVLSNREDAKVLQSAKDLGIKTMYHSNKEVANGEFLTSLCKNDNIDWIVLAGYLRLIPGELIDAYDHKMINLHPSLLPDYGGKGMFGRNVHKAVIENRETESGITIHYVNREFDKGKIIAQFRCILNEHDTVESLESKIRTLEQTYLPKVVEGTVLNN